MNVIVRWTPIQDSLLIIDLDQIELELVKPTSLDNCLAWVSPISSSSWNQVPCGFDPYLPVASYSYAVHLRLSKTANKLRYLNIIGPYISYATQHFSQFLQQPRQPRMQATMYVMRYLTGIRNQGLLYPVTNDLKVTTYCDVDCGTYHVSARSWSSWITFCVFLWSSIS